ncbi:hypothetical protein [Rheinheimera sp.]|uniref:hypothetical protein n=1 Tax=Rheinheimera sp. TaxID=1869214 RepID=UPI00307EB9DD
MAATLIIGIPVLLILALVILLKKEASASYKVIFILGVFTPFLVDILYCSALKNECPPDPLNVMGHLLLSVYVIAISSVIYRFLPARLKGP